MPPVLRTASLILNSLFLCSLLPAEPQPGDVFREYTWAPTTTGAAQGLHVGGNRKTGSRWGSILVENDNWVSAPIALGRRVNLQGALRLEATIEKVLNHAGTTGLGISLNGGDWIDIPDPATLPQPSQEFQHHVYPTIPLPLDQLRGGPDNSFRLRVSAHHPNFFPVSMIYGVIFRVYHDPTRVDAPHGRLLSPGTGDTLGREVELQIEANPGAHRIKQVDYLGLYEGVNWRGDGVYRQWQYHFLRGEIIHHLGSTRSRPYSLTWDTAWVPDQPGPVALAARIVDDSNLIYMTEAVTDLRLERPNLSVELCKPSDVSPRWTTSRASHQESFTVKGNLDHARRARLVWSSWSPGYMNGVFINDVKVFDREGPLYNYYDHEVEVSDLSMFKSGKNVLRTGMSERPDGKGVHGMEVNWPGIMVLIQYEVPDQTSHP